MCVCVCVGGCITIRTTHTPEARPDAAEHGGPGLYTLIRNAIHTQGVNNGALFSPITVDHKN